MQQQSQHPFFAHPMLRVSLLPRTHTVHHKARERESACARGELLKCGNDFCRADCSVSITAAAAATNCSQHVPIVKSKDSRRRHGTSDGRSVAVVDGCGGELLFSHARRRRRRRRRAGSKTKHVRSVHRSLTHRAARAHTSV